MVDYLSDHMKRLIAREYPIVQNADRLQALEVIARQAFERGTLAERIAAIAIFHQILQELVVHVIETSRFHLECLHFESDQAL